MNSSVDDEAKNRAVKRIAERIAEESENLPFRWGYFQGAVLIPWSLLVISSVVSDLVTPRPYPWYLLTIGLLMGLLGLPLAYGLLRKRAFALPLVHVMFGLTLLLTAIRITHVMRHYADTGEKSSGSFHAANYQPALESFCGSDKEKLVREIRRLVLHELAHHLGMSHDRMKEIGL